MEWPRLRQKLVSGAVCVKHCRTALQKHVLFILSRPVPICRVCGHSRSRQGRVLWDWRISSSLDRACLVLRGCKRPSETKTWGRCLCLSTKEVLGCRSSCIRQSEFDLSPYPAGFVGGLRPSSSGEKGLAQVPTASCSWGMGLLYTGRVMGVQSGCKGAVVTGEVWMIPWIMSLMISLIKSLAEGPGVTLGDRCPVSTTVPGGEFLANRVFCSRPRSIGRWNQSSKPTYLRTFSHVGCGPDQVYSRRRPQCCQCSTLRTGGHPSEWWMSPCKSWWQAQRGQGMPVYSKGPDGQSSSSSIWPGPPILPTCGESAWCRSLGSAVEGKRVMQRDSIGCQFNLKYPQWLMMCKMFINNRKS